MARFYVEHNGEWNIFSTIVDDFLLDEFVCIDALKAHLLYERYKELTEDIDSLMTDRPRVNVMSYTEATERMRKTEPQNYCDDCLYTDTCDSKEFFYACTSKATISKMEQVEEPQTKYPCDTCANKGDHDGECSNCVSSSETIKWKTPSHYKPKDEPQTDWNETLPCHKCESALSSEYTACDGQQYFRTEEGETDCPWK